jgi:aspartate aminotransferase
MTGARPVLIPTSPETGFKLKPEQLRQAISPRSRLVMINSPCNPTGVVYSRSELERLADVVLESPIAVLSDEIYEQLTYGDAKPTCFATLRPALADRTLTISGASKTYAMTGWRIGWTVGPKPIIDAMSNIQSQDTSCSSSVSQSALLAALTGPQDCVAQMRAEFAKRRELVCRRFEAIPGIRLLKPDGAFYAFFDVSAYFNKPIAGGPFHDSTGFCQAALQVAHVAFVPGSAFGFEGYARMSFACSTQLLEAGLDRLDQWLQGKLSD